MSAYIPTIGLEIHAELKTRTKMFCNSKNDPDEKKPNVNVCPICMGFPGTLPVVNKEAVRHVLRMGVAVGGTIADYTEFDRKSYFYPDLPKGYQISQYQYPLVSGGVLADVSITRIHLEEDTARSQHSGENFSIVDFNRAGIPLMELVTEPVIHDAKTARFFAEELQRLIRYLGAGEANMEKGEMRVEANVSVSKTETTDRRGTNAEQMRKLGTKVEVKNLNSFRSVELAIGYEIQRQTEMLERGERVIQETRGWNEVKEETYPQRLKESSHDYRYFPDPDIPKFHLSRIAEFGSESLLKTLPELPWEKRSRYLSKNIRKDDAEILVADELYSRFFDLEVLKLITEPTSMQIALNYLLSDVRGQGVASRELERISSGLFAELIALIQKKTLSSRGAKDVLGVMLKEGGKPEEIAKHKGLIQISDSSALSRIVLEVIQENEAIAGQVRTGKTEALRFLMGQAMRKSKGAGDPAELERIFKEKLLPVTGYRLPDTE